MRHVARPAPSCQASRPAASACPPSCSSVVRRPLSPWAAAVPVQDKRNARALLRFSGAQARRGAGALSGRTGRAAAPPAQSSSSRPRGRRARAAAVLRPGVLEASARPCLARVPIHRAVPARSAPDLQLPLRRACVLAWRRAGGLPARGSSSSSSGPAAVAAAPPQHQAARRAASNTWYRATAAEEAAQHNSGGELQRSSAAAQRLARCVGGKGREGATVESDTRRAPFTPLLQLRSSSCSCVASQERPAEQQHSLQVERWRSTRCL